jgi:hypothetical protein
MNIPPRITELALAQMVLKVALELVGLKEIRHNSKWDDPTTHQWDQEKSDRVIALMRPAPWEPGWAYCIALVEGIYRDALTRCGATDEEVKKFSRVIGAHVMTSYRNFEAKGLVSPLPTMGAIWLAQHGKTDTGHAGIVVSQNKGSTMNTFEGNTSKQFDPANPKAEREGDWITLKTRKNGINGDLKTRGFVSVASVLKLIYS